MKIQELKLLNDKLSGTGDYLMVPLLEVLPESKTKLTKQLIYEMVALDNLVTFFVPSFILNFLTPYYNAVMSDPMTFHFLLVFYYYIKAYYLVHYNLSSFTLSLFAGSLNLLCNLFPSSVTSILHLKKKSIEEGIEGGIVWFFVPDKLKLAFLKENIMEVAGGEKEVTDSPFAKYLAEEHMPFFVGAFSQPPNLIYSVNQDMLLSCYFTFLNILFTKYLLIPAKREIITSALANEEHLYLVVSCSLLYLAYEIYNNN